MKKQTAKPWLAVGALVVVAGFAGLIEVRPPERVLLAGAEISERHMEAAAHRGVERVDATDETVRRQPARQGLGVEEGTVDLLGFARSTRCSWTVPVDMAILL